MIDFLSAIWTPGTIGELRALPGGKQWFGHWTTEADVFEKQIRYWDEQGLDVYYGVLNRTSRSGTAKDTVPTTRVLWSDIDGKQFEGGQVQALFALGKADLTPSILVDSGHGFHAYWLLREPVLFKEAQSVMGGLAEAIGGDTVNDAARILRIPGTHNYKDGEKVPVRLLYFDPSRTYRFDDFSGYMPRLVTHYRNPLVSDGWNLSTEDAPKFPEGERNRGLTRLAGIMVAKDVDDENLYALLSMENEIRCDPPLPEREVQAIARSVGRYR